MPSRRQPATDSEFDTLRFRRSRATLKTAFLRATIRLTPIIWHELFGRSDLTAAVGPYEWPAYDHWATQHNLTSTSDYADWLRIFAWGRRNRRTLPGTLYWRDAVERDMRRARSQVDRTRSRAHRADDLAAEAFVRWQVLGQSWRSIQSSLPERKSLDAIRDLVFRTGYALSVTPRLGRRGRPKLPKPS